MERSLQHPLAANALKPLVVHRPKRKATGLGVGSRFILQAGIRERVLAGATVPGVRSSTVRAHGSRYRRRGRPPRSHTTGPRKSGNHWKNAVNGSAWGHERAPAAQCLADLWTDFAQVLEVRRCCICLSAQLPRTWCDRLAVRAGPPANGLCSVAPWRIPGGGGLERLQLPRWLHWHRRSVERVRPRDTIVRRCEKDRMSSPWSI